jgi:hypothetical protein
MQPLFNYIITIHNKEELIEQVLHSVIQCCNSNSYIYPVLDGCIDKSESIVDEVILKNPKIPIIKVKVNDVHEIMSINAGLKISGQSVKGYNIILQDDVILMDFEIEKKITHVYEKIGDQLGYLSFRLGANLKPDILETNESAPLMDYIESAFGHGIDKSKVLLPGQFAFRSIAIKSPVCIPTLIINKFGLLDENLSPCFHDDTEYSLRLLKNGYKNGIFGIKYQSDLEWGGTRKKPNPELYKYMKKNIDYLKIKYRDIILKIIASPQDKNIIAFAEYTDNVKNQKALYQYKRNNKQRMKFQSQGLPIIPKIKHYIKRIINYSFTII